MRDGFGRSGPGLKNSVEWVCFDVAALWLGWVTVPLHVTDGPHNWADRLVDAKPKLLLIGALVNWQALDALPLKFESLELIICIEPVPRATEGVISLDTWLPRETAPYSQPVDPEDLATITYTSGTTGRPKGVMLSHRNILFAANATLQRNPGYLEDVFLSFLPMAHIFERTTEYYVAMMCGGQIAFARSVAELPEDFTAIRPTIVMGVPRIFERI